MAEINGLRTIKSQYFASHSTEQRCQTPPRFTRAWPQIPAEHLCLHARHALDRRSAEHVLGKDRRNRGRNGSAADVTLFFMQLHKTVFFASFVILEE